LQILLQGFFVFYYKIPFRMASITLAGARSASHSFFI